MRVHHGAGGDFAQRRRSQGNGLDDAVVDGGLAQFLMEQELDLAIECASFGEHVPLDVVGNAEVVVELRQIMGNATEGGEGSDFTR